MIPGWDKDTKDEYLQILQEIGSAVPRDFAMRLGVSECCAVYWLTELARQGRLRITGVEAGERGGCPLRHGILRELSAQGHLSGGCGLAG